MLFSHSGRLEQIFGNLTAFRCNSDFLGKLKLKTKFMVCLTMQSRVIWIVTFRLHRASFFRRSGRLVMHYLINHILFRNQILFRCLFLVTTFQREITRNILKKTWYGGTEKIRGGGENDVTIDPQSLTPEKHFFDKGSTSRMYKRTFTERSGQSKTICTEEFLVSL